MNKLSENRFVCFLLTLLSVIFVFVIFHTENRFGGTDNFSHFNLAYWGWKHPGMLFDHWGKPMFTLPASVFAQFGFNGVRIYNVLMGLATACFSWRIARYFHLHQAWIVVILVIFMPVYFILMFTSLTEVTFSFLITLAILLFFKKQYIWSAVIISLLPLARTEGVVIIPLFILAFILKKEYRALPFLAIGFLLFSLAGWSFYHSFWWLITDMPYNDSAKNIYGSGSLFHFVTQSPNIFGMLPGLFFIAGIIVLFINWGRKNRFETNDTFYFLLLITGSFLVFFAAHSYVWWRGIGNSLGLIRVIGSVTPLAALTAMFGVSWLFDIKIKNGRIIISVLLVIAFGFFIRDTIRREMKYFHADPSQYLMNEVVSYLKTNNLDHYKIVYYDPYLAFRMHLDPDNPDKSRERLSHRPDFITSEPDSTIIVWDAHYGPNEGKMPLEKLKNQEHLKVLQIFTPEQPVRTLGGYPYQIIVFQKK